jgi:hypothetical protein
MNKHDYQERLLRYINDIEALAKKLQETKDISTKLTITSKLENLLITFSEFRKNHKQ